ncbi:MAG: prepilin-type N-terminal cleavage/methylation domain-containing protein [Gammaproteobacteria bacterium]|nr:prepilin-type N-terminal cleavage/methylation domain-containing protein [Gammaproteobacteria bacterium]
MKGISVRYSKGFTLIELMITIVILSILVSIAIPSFQETIRRNTVTATANDLIASLLFARSEAIKREQNVAIITSDNWASGWEIFIDSNKNNVKNNGEEVLNSYTLDIANISIAGNGGVNTAIVYSPSGRIKNTLTSPTTDFLQISNKDLTRCIRFSLTGRPRVDKLSRDNGGCS